MSTTVTYEPETDKVCGGCRRRPGVYKIVGRTAIIRRCDTCQNRAGQPSTAALRKTAQAIKARF